MQHADDSNFYKNKPQKDPGKYQKKREEKQKQKIKTPRPQELGLAMLPITGIHQRSLCTRDITCAAC